MADAVQYVPRHLMHAQQTSDDDEQKPRTYEFLYAAYSGFPRDFFFFHSDVIL